jgi:acyl carrier protein
MLTPTATIVRIEESHRQARLSPAQKKFNATIRKIDKQKQLLAVWQETLPRYQQLVAEQFTPLRETYGEHQAEMAHLLDRHHGHKAFSRPQKKKIAHLVREICNELINTLEREDLKPLYNKYSETDFDTRDQEVSSLAGDFMKSMLESELGIEIDDDAIDVNSPEKIAAFVQEKLDERERQAEERRRRRKKTAKQLAKEARQQEEEARLGKSIQVVYRQLVTALHPDREQDPVERERKTELMQRVTVAYGRKDLLQLLELQLTVEQIDQSKINTLDDDRLRYYNRILQGQLEQLEQEVLEIEFTAKQQAGLAPFDTISPRHLIQLVHEDIERLHGEIASIRHDLIELQEVKNLKAWLKDYRIPTGTDGMMEDLDALFSNDNFPPFGFR